MSAQAPHLSHPKYRPDIDGLRAIAVLSVVVYHAFPKRLEGGFLGVDVFFVISGFLISTILFENLNKGTFSFWEFSARRIRRIFPALFLVLVACGIAGWLVLLPEDFKLLGLHIAGGAGFVSNFVLWKETGYFDSAADTKPLLHLWSLGIEEQFYIVWPLLLWFAWRKNFNLLFVAVLACGVSFALNLLKVDNNAVAAFYSPQTRIWELLCGSFLAWSVTFKKDAVARLLGTVDSFVVRAVYRTPGHADGTTTANGMAIVGILLLAYGFRKIDGSLQFPGAWPLIPIVGTLLLLGAGQRAWINRVLLSNKLAVWIGLISYPLYLWHWPLLSFARLIENETPHKYIRLGLLAVAVLLSLLTYRLLERPIRTGSHGKTKVLILVLLISACAGAGFVVFSKDGVPSRYPAIVQALTKFDFDYKSAYREGTCFLRPKQDAKAFASCPTPPANRSKTLLLWGDSHAAHLYPGINKRYGDDYAITQRTASSCPPAIGLDVEARPHCLEINSEVFKLVTAQRPDKVVLAGAWVGYDLDKLVGRLQNTIRQLKSLGISDITLVGPVPLWKDSLSKQLFNYFNEHGKKEVPYRMKYGLNLDFHKLDPLFRDIAETLKTKYLSPYDYLCDDEGCITRLGETSDSLMVWDNAHLTSRGSEYLIQKFPSF